jgi:hypothetical protein
MKFKEYMQSHVETEVAFWYWVIENKLEKKDMTFEEWDNQFARWFNTVYMEEP